MNSIVLLIALFSPNAIASNAASFSPKDSVQTELHAPSGATTFMVSEDYAQIDWNRVAGADAYKIQILGLDGHPVLILEDKTVWTSFYFRVANSQARYSFRIAAIRKGTQSEWTTWMEMDTKK